MSRCTNPRSFANATALHTAAKISRCEASRWIRVFDPYEGPVWSATQVSLIESHLGQGRGRRPRYEVLAELPLA